MGIHSRETSRDFRVGRNCTLYRCALFEIIDDEIDKEIQGNNIAGKQTARERFIFTKTAICYPLVFRIARRENFIVFDCFVVPFRCAGMTLNAEMIIPSSATVILRISSQPIKF